ncbi:SRPBCC domain-containing protein [Bacteroidota bacterium]
MLKIESKIGTVLKPQVDIYNFLSKLNNLEDFIPADKIKNWQATEDTCSFEVEMAGELNIEIVNREPHKTLKLKGNSAAQPLDFFFWIQLKEVNPGDTKVKLTLHAEVPAMIKSMAKKPLQEALNVIIDKLPDLLKNI